MWYLLLMVFGCHCMCNVCRRGQHSKCNFNCDDGS